MEHGYSKINVNYIERYLLSSSPIRYRTHATLYALYQTRNKGHAASRYIDVLRYYKHENRTSFYVSTRCANIMKVF
jgi:hypothetical protein